MKKIFVMFATVAAFTLASCGGKAEQKATEDPKDTAPVETPKAEEQKPAADAKQDSSSMKKEGVTEAPKEVAPEMKKEEAKPAEVKKEEVKK